MRSAATFVLHRNTAKVAGVALAAVALATGVTPSAWAAAPSNDAPAGAVQVSPGAHITQDTSEATSGDADTALNAGCGAPATTASVWYRITAATDGGILLDASASSYPAGFLVFRGSTPTAESLVTCGPQTIAFSTTAGTTYSIMVIDDESDGDPAPGGTLRLSVSNAPSAPTVDVSVNPKGKATKSGSAVISGSFTCTDADTVLLEGQLTQRVGRAAVTGSGITLDPGTCDGNRHPFVIEIAPDNGRFAGGKSVSVVFSFACGVFECTDGFVEQRVQLSRGRGPRT